MPNTNDLQVDSSPSKRFFLDMITKDVTVESSILDLIDNSIDAYKKNKRSTNATIDIILSLKDDCFMINDNCGGMKKETAINKAFKFGNNEDRSFGALGMYGIGMKRSIFKIGDDFIVESKCGDDSYKVFMNRNEWLNLKDTWKFYIEDIQLNIEDGVHIKINKLSDSLKTYLKFQSNVERLKKQIARTYKESLSKDIIIKVNGENVSHYDEILFESDILKTYVKSYTIKDLSVKIIAGIGLPSPSDAGWNIICNGRTVVEKNKDNLTGWEVEYLLDEEGNIDSDLKETDKKLPAFHNDYARFRGYIYLDSYNANNLPLNTTKDGLDKQHPVYEQIFMDMTYAMHLILPKLRNFQIALRDMKKNGMILPTTDFIEKSLSEMINKDKQEFLFNIDDFKAINKMKNITISIAENEIAKWKQYFEVKTNKDLGYAMLEFIKERVCFDE